MKADHTMKMCRQAFDQLVEEVEAGRSATLVEYLKVMGRFHRYSLFNQMLILQQQPNSRQVAGFWTWKKLGRSVVKGAKGIAIMAPIVYRKKSEAEAEIEDEEAVDAEIVRKFKVCYVFDVSDTEGKALPEPCQAKGDPGVYLARLESFIAAQGIKLETRNLYGAIQGYAGKGAIVLQSGSSPAEACSTLLHELCHQLLHIRNPVNELSRNVREVEAEAVAFVVGTGIGLEMGSSSSDYISLYNGRKQDLLNSLQRVQMTASEILAAITKEEKLLVTARAA